MKKSLIGASDTHVGLVKENNEDAIMLHIKPSKNGNRRGLLMVADGVGGHLAGEVASGIAIQTVSESMIDVLERPEAEDSDASTGVGEGSLGIHLVAALRETVEKANQTIFEYAQEHQKEAGNLGTTATCGLIYDDLLIIAHVGDSRAYRLRDGSLEQLTEDHTFVGELVRRGQVSPVAFYEHPRRHVITRALGQNPEIVVDTNTFNLKPGDRLLFCSDGLWEMVRDDEIHNFLSNAPSPQVAVAALINSAIEAGGVDNIGVVVGEIHGN